MIDTAWHPVLRSSAVRDGPVAAELLGHRLAVFRDTAGAVHTLDDRCPHRGTALSLGTVAGGQLSCPYHGWTFDGSGRCLRIPSLGSGPSIPEGASATAYAAAEVAGLVWVNLDREADPATIRPLPTAAGVPGLRVITGEPMVWRTSAGRHVENILDLAHFPFVHPATFGCPEAETVEPHEVVVRPGVVTCDVGVTTRNPVVGDGYLYPELGPLIRLGYRYRVDVPYRITLEFEFPDGMQRALHEVVAPTAADRCTIFWLLLVDERLSSPDEEELAFARRVFAEDQPVIESQPPGVPVDRRAEVHVPADRLAVAYRRALREAGVPEGALV
jgi:phenylpropionate dioxygenase-like ring-hydroxylating dioxygenase large terminal subunit